MSERDLFIAALQITVPAERSAWLDRECAGDAVLRERIDELLHAFDKAGSLLENPVVAAGPAFDEPITEGPGTAIGPYKLLEQIGEGGFGVVFMAEQTEPVRRKVALKVLKPGMDTRQVVARFEAERQALAIMDHPNIAKVFDGGTTGEPPTSVGGDSQTPPAYAGGSQRPYFVMELVKGVPITEFCDQNCLRLRQRLEMFIPVCQAVQHAHQKGIIHRDLKPSNILVSRHDTTPVVKVIDFGVAKALGQELTDKSLFTGIAQMIGTPLYMSPEQAGMSDLDVDTRSDIYSLGVLLYELLTGTTPFDKERLRTAGYDEVRRIIREEEPAKPSTRLSSLGAAADTVSANRGSEPKRLNALVRGELDWIVMKALEKDRNRRYETANGFAMDVQRYLADEPVLACRPTAGYRLRKIVKRNRPQVIAASVVLLALVAGVICTTLGLVRANRAAEDERIARNDAIEQQALAEQAAEQERRAKQEAITERDAKAKALAAETQAREAEKQARVRAMAGLRDMTDAIVEQQMARGTTLTEENKEFLRKIIKHFEGFAAITAGDGESRSIRAEGYHRVGLMRYRLGELKEAEAAYADALALFKQLAADFPTRPEIRRDLAGSHINLGNLFASTGRLTDAEAAHADALAIFRQLAADFPNWPEFRRELARSHGNLGILFKDTGRLQKAEAAYADALALRKQLAADFPTRPEFRRELAKSHVSLGLLLSETGRLKEAEAAYADALALQKQLAADFPARPEFRHELAKSHGSLGLLLSETGRLKEAEAAHADALAIFRQLAAEFPARPEFRQDLARSHGNLGILFKDTGRLQKAEGAYADALALRKQLAADFPARPEFRHELAKSHSSLGLLLSGTGRLKEAAAAYADAVALQKQLAADFPNRPDMRNDLAGTFVNLALLGNQRRDFAAASAYLEKAQPHHQAALKANPQHPVYRQFYRNNLFALVMANAGLPDQAGALRAAAQLRDLGWHAPGNAYDAACALSLCIPIVQNDEKATEEERAKATQFYGDETMNMLKDAVAKGWKNAARMKKDTALDPLRQRPDFRSLLAELEASK